VAGQEVLKMASENSDFTQIQIDRLNAKLDKFADVVGGKLDSLLVETTRTQGLLADFAQIKSAVQQHDKRISALETERKDLKQSRDGFRSWSGWVAALLIGVVEIVHYLTPLH
jgi:hypothetical protein